VSTEALKYDHTMFHARPDPANDLAARKRQVVRDELTDAAMRLLARKGFADTTVEEIVAAAGVSRRTFFRHFASKEDVVVQFLDDMGVAMCAAMRERPASESAATALRQTLRLFADQFRDETEKAHAVTRQIYTEPVLRARLLERQDQWRAELAVEVARRAGTAPDDPRARLTAAIGLAALDEALSAWMGDGAGRDVGALVEQALELVVTPLN
jgi:AcrR family transcriptional regulator